MAGFTPVSFGYSGVPTLQAIVGYNTVDSSLGMAQYADDWRQHSGGNPAGVVVIGENATGDEQQLKRNGG